MSSSNMLSANTAVAAAPSRANSARFLYVGAATVLLVLVFLGFQQFYLHGRAFPDRDITPPIRSEVILHGVSMTGWIVLFLVQPLLIVSGNRRVHVILGRLGAVLAAAVVVFGLRVAIGSARVSPPEMLLWGLNPKQFLAIPVISMVLFAMFVGLGVWYRQRPQVHRPMMLLSVLAALPAALDRIVAIRTLYESTFWGAIFGPTFSVLVLGAIFFVVHRLLTRRWDPYYGLGYAALVAASALMMQVAPTRAWQQIANFLTG